MDVNLGRLQARMRDGDAWSSQSVGSQRVSHDLATEQQQPTWFYPGRRRRGEASRSRLPSSDAGLAPGCTLPPPQPKARRARPGTRGAGGPTGPPQPSRPSPRDLTSAVDISLVGDGSIFSSQGMALSPRMPGCPERQLPVSDKHRLPYIRTRWPPVTTSARNPR